MPYPPGHLLFNKYRLERLLGTGAFGEVWLATHTGLNAPRAVKLLRKDAPGLGSQGFEEYRARFQLEAQLGARLKHPRLVQVHDFEQHGETLALVMEYCPGGSLAERLAQARQQGQPLALEPVVRMAGEVAQALAALHQQDWVHRDLHPGNILFDEQGRARLADLGCVQTPGGLSARSQHGSLSVPHPGHPDYRSPEHENPSKSLAPAADIYMLGAVLFEALTLRSYNHLKPGTRLRSLRPDAPQWIDDLLNKMLARDPAQRPWDGQAVTKLLQQGSRSRPILPGWAWIASGIALALIVVISFIVMLTKLTFREDAGPITAALQSTSQLPATANPIAAQTQYLPTARPTDTLAPVASSIQSESTPLPLTPTLSPSPSLSPSPTLTFTPTPRPSQIIDAQGVPMVLVPAGPFTMGVDADSMLGECQALYIGGSCLRAWFEDGQPAHTVALDDYYIDLYEVTNARYEECVNAGVCEAPSNNGSYTRSSYYGNPAFKDYPVVYVSWQNAVTYCQHWREARLPSEAEWEKAARGTDGRLYPWGNSFDGMRANFCDSNCPEDWGDFANFSYNDGFADTAPVGYYPSGASPYGVLDLAGNVFEWVADCYAADFYGNAPAHNPLSPSCVDTPVLRGGSWGTYGSSLSTAFRYHYTSTRNYFSEYGFRCARTP